MKYLLTTIPDPRRSTYLRFKGMTANYCRLVALKKISGVDAGRKFVQVDAATPASYFYLNWAIAKGHLKNKTMLTFITTGS